tara:strand:+ start:109 stop:519 length:411 start_codon:yes stop_codon:yes gene_type:complete
MDLVKIFRVLVVVNFIAAMSHLLIDYDALIVSNNNLSSVFEESYISVTNSWNIILILVYLLAAFLTGPLLFFFVKWSRELVVGLLTYLIIILLVDGSKGYYTIGSELQYLATSIEALTHGAILAIAYLTPLKDKFN